MLVLFWVLSSLLYQLSRVWDNCGNELTSEATHSIQRKCSAHSWNALVNGECDSDATQAEKYPQFSLNSCITRQTTGESLVGFFVFLLLIAIFLYVVGAMAYRGDLIACEVDFDSQTNSFIPILFSLNGKEVARTRMKYTAGQTKLYPFISLGHEGIRVLAKVCQSCMIFFSDETCFVIWIVWNKISAFVLFEAKPNRVFTITAKIPSRPLANFHW